MDIEILNPERLDYWCDLIAIPPGAAAELQDTAARVRADPGLGGLFEAFHEKTALRGEWHRDWAPLDFDPRVVDSFGERSALFYLLAYLSALPGAWLRYQDLGVSLDIFKATLLDFSFAIQDYYDLNGRWGLSDFGWLWRHLTGEIFRLGRLQYLLAPFSGGVTAFRRKEGSSGTGLVSPVLLADSDLPLRPDGCAWGAGQPGWGKILLGPDTWYPLFEGGPAGWRGHLVSPYGQVQKSTVFLPADEWEILLQKGDTILELHIPRKDAFDEAACRASYTEARAFFARVFPQKPYKALFCHTWMFSPQLQQMLAPESNLVRFQREFSLYPGPGNPGFLWSYVFGQKWPSPTTAPRDTALRRAVLDWLEQGGEIFDLPGLMFHPPEAWGTQPAVREWDASIGGKYAG